MNLLDKIKLRFKKGIVYEVPDEAIICLDGASAEDINVFSDALLRRFPCKSIMVMNTKIKIVSIGKTKKIVITKEKVKK